MTSPKQRDPGLDLDALDAITAAVESGAGLPDVVRAAAKALEASLVLLDRAGSVLAVAARSPADERSLLDGAAGVLSIELRVADATVGQLRMRTRVEPGPALVRLVTTLVASEVERVRAPVRASRHWSAPTRKPALPSSETASASSASARRMTADCSSACFASSPIASRRFVLPAALSPKTTWGPPGNVTSSEA